MSRELSRFSGTAGEPRIRPHPRLRSGRVRPVPRILPGQDRGFRGRVRDRMPASAVFSCRSGLPIDPRGFDSEGTAMAGRIRKSVAVFTALVVMLGAALPAGASTDAAETVSCVEPGSSVRPPPAGAQLRSSRVNPSGLSAAAGDDEFKWQGACRSPPPDVRHEATSPLAQSTTC